MPNEAHRARRPFNVRLALLLSTLPVTALASPAWAQDAAAPAADSGQIEDIVVTAQKRSENLQDVPIVITALTAESMDKLGVLRNDDIGIAVPGLVMNRQNGASTPYLRGVGSSTSTVGVESPNAIYIDGVYIPSMTGAVFSFNNIERLEVLKGPQGTLFGRNSAGGLINVITHDPKHEFSGDASIGYARYNRIDGKLYLTGGLSSTIAVDIAGHYSRQSDGRGVNLRNPDVEGPKGKAYGVRGKLLFEPTDNTRITLSADYNYDRNSLGIWRQLAPGTTGLDGVTRYSGKYYDINSNLNPDSINRMGGAALTIEQDFGAVIVKSITGYRRDHNDQIYDQDATPAPIVNALLDFRTKSFTQELQISSNNDGSLKWIAGLFYFWSRASMNGSRIEGAAATAAGGRITFVGDGQTTKSYAGYAQATLALGEATNITLGGRYTSDRKELSAGRINAAGASLGFREAGRTYNKFTYRAAIDHHLTDDVLMFASYNRGFKSGAFNVSQPFDNPVKPEVIDAVEGGFKSDLLDRHLRLNLSGFYYWYDNIQLTTLLAGSPTPTLFNAASSKVKGIELEVTVVPVTGFTVTAAGTYLDGRYKDFLGAPFSVPAARGNTIVIGDASGNRMIRSPKFSGNITVAYDIPTSFGSLQFSMTEAYKSSFFWEADNRLKEGNTHLVSADITARFGANENAYVRVYGRNLLSERYSIYTVGSSIGDAYAAGEPATYGVEFGLKF